MILELLHANVRADRYDYGKTWPKRRPHFVEAARAVEAPIVTLTECQKPAADLLAGLLGYRAASFWGSSILYDPAVLVLTRTLLTRRWLTGTQTHSLLMVEFGIRSTRQRFNLGVSHFPPFATRANLRKQQLRWITQATASYADPTFVAMDANWSKTLEWCAAQHGGWQSARLKATTRVHADYRTSGSRYSKGNPIDYVLARKPGASFVYYDVLDGRKWSDHNALNVEIGVR